MRQQKDSQPGGETANGSSADATADTSLDDYDESEQEDGETDETHAGDYLELDESEQEDGEYLELDDVEVTDEDEFDDEPPTVPVKPAKSQKSRTKAPASTRPSPLRLDRATKIAVDRIDDHERRYALTAAFGGALLWSALYVSWAFSHAKTPKGSVPVSTDFYFGIAVCALVLIATLLRRRALIGFAVIFLALTFTSTTTGFLISVPFFAFGGWLIIRAFKIQAKVARGELSVDDAIAGKAPSILATGNRPRDIYASGKAARGSKAARSTASTNKRYTNKRYTPPKPKRKMPPAKAEPKS